MRANDICIERNDCRQRRRLQTVRGGAGRAGAHRRRGGRRRRGFRENRRQRVRAADGRLRPAGRRLLPARQTRSGHLRRRPEERGAHPRLAAHPEGSQHGHDRRVRGSRPAHRVHPQNGIRRHLFL